MADVSVKEVQALNSRISKLNTRHTEIVTKIGRYRENLKRELEKYLEEFGVNLSGNSLSVIRQKVDFETKRVADAVSSEYALKKQVVESIESGDIDEAIRLLGVEGTGSEKDAGIVLEGGVDPLASADDAKDEGGADDGTEAPVESSEQEKPFTEEELSEMDFNADDSMFSDFGFDLELEDEDSGDGDSESNGSEGDTGNEEDGFSSVGHKDTSNLEVEGGTGDLEVGNRVSADGSFPASELSIDGELEDDFGFGELLGKGSKF